MMKLVGIISVSVITSLILIGFNTLSGNGFVFLFINNNAFDISTTLLGFNIAIHTILIGQITNIENAINYLGYFKENRKELKDNAYFNLFLLCFILFLRRSKIEEGGTLFKIVPTFI